MKKEIFISLSFFILLFNFCEKQIIPEFITDDNTSALFNSGLELDAINNEIEISFDINVKWAIEVMYKNASGWCNVTPLIGEIGKNNILIKVDENSSYEDRAVTLIFKFGDLFKKLEITQRGRETLIINPKSIKISGKGGNINVQTMANVNYNIEIPDTIQWIQQKITKALTTKNYEFIITTNPLDISRKGVVLFKSNESNITDTLLVYQDSVQNFSFRGTSNSYVLPLNSYGKIKISNMGNNTDSKLIKNGFVEHEILWVDNKDVPNVQLVSDVKIIDEYLYFQTNNHQGNTLIAIKNDGEIIWSWHLWILSDAEKINKFQMTSRLGFMDRNLGAVKSTDQGLHYQWGRKDPLLIGEYTEETIADNLEQSIKNPTIYYAREGYTEYYDAFSWYKGMNVSLWGNIKTIYDPCPYGFIVPDKSNWFVPKDIVGWNNNYFIYDQADSFYPSGIHLEWRNGGNSSWAPYWTSNAFYSYPHRWRAAYYLDPSLGIRSDGIACAFGLYVRCIRYDKEN